jgi:ribonuclease VapC
MFVDTSALVAILVREPEADDLAARIEGARSRFTSGLVVIEAAVQLSAMLAADPVAVEQHVQRFLAEAGISIMPINGAIATRAAVAFAKYGAGRGHPAQLSLADCMTYACAAAYRVPILFKGDGFAQTDALAA